MQSADPNKPPWSNDECRMSNDEKQKAPIRHSDFVIRSQRQHPAPKSLRAHPPKPRPLPPLVPAFDNHLVNLGHSLLPLVGHRRFTVTVTTTRSTNILPVPSPPRGRFREG